MSNGDALDGWVHRISFQCERQRGHHAPRDGNRRLSRFSRRRTAPPAWSYVGRTDRHSLKSVALLRTYYSRNTAPTGYKGPSAGRYCGEDDSPGGAAKLGRRHLYRRDFSALRGTCRCSQHRKLLSVRTSSPDCDASPESDDTEPRHTIALLARQPRPSFASTDRACAARAHS